MTLMTQKFQILYMFSEISNKRHVSELGSKCELEEITPIWSKQVTLILFFPQVVNGRLPVNN
jgi:hypothetical protein